MKSMRKASLITPAFQKKNFEDKYTLKKIEEIFFTKRGHTFKMPKPGESVILLLSGGLDSVCLWYILMKKYQLHVYPLHISRHFFCNPEKKAVNFFSSFFKKKCPLFFHPPRFFTDQSSINLEKNVNPTYTKFDLNFIIQNLSYNLESKKYKVHLIGNPTRQLRYLFDSYEYAFYLKYQKGVSLNTVFCGILMDDSSSLREATLSVMRSVNLTLCLILGDFSWQFTGASEKEGGFSYYKKDLVTLAIKNGLPMEKTRSCGYKFFFSCGFCPSCRSRKKVFQSLGIPDKTFYLTNLVTKVINIKKVSSFFKKFVYHRKKKGQRIDKKYVSILPDQLESLKLFVSPNTVWQNIDGTVFLLNKNEGLLESLNPIGSFIFDQIAKQKKINLKDILDQLSKKYPVEKTVLKKDLMFFAHQLLEKDYLKVN